MDAIEHIKQLVEFKPTLTTSEVVKYLANKHYHADAIRTPENKMKLGAERINGKRNLRYNTHKVVLLKMQLSSKDYK